MDVPGFARLLRQQNMDSEVWWDSSPTECALFKGRMLSLYPDMSDYIAHLLPEVFSRQAGDISGATTNPSLISRTVLENSAKWRDYLASLSLSLPSAEKARRVYDQAIVEGANVLYPSWVGSARRHGWLSAQIDGGERMGEGMLVARGLQLASLAPNIMVKVPGSEQGYRAIEQLVAEGCSVNNTISIVS